MKTFSREQYLNSYPPCKLAGEDEFTRELAELNPWPLRCDGLPVVDGYVNDPRGDQYFVFPSWIKNA